MRRSERTADMSESEEERDDDAGGVERAMVGGSFGAESCKSAASECGCWPFGLWGARVSVREGEKSTQRRRARVLSVLHARKTEAQWLAGYLWAEKSPSCDAIGGTIRLGGRLAEACSGRRSRRRARVCQKTAGNRSGSAGTRTKSFAQGWRRFRDESERRGAVPEAAETCKEKRSRGC